jgi:hypothetical protein
VTEKNTKTLTPTLWSLLNLLPRHTHQPPHRYAPLFLPPTLPRPASVGSASSIAPPTAFSLAGTTLSPWILPSARRLTASTPSWYVSLPPSFLPSLPPSLPPALPPF